MSRTYTEEQLERKRAYNRVYAKCAKSKAYGRLYGKSSKRKEYIQAYRQRPEVKQRLREYNRIWSQKPELKAYAKAYKQRPECKEQQRLYRKVYKPLYYQRAKERILAKVKAYRKTEGYAVVRARYKKRNEKRIREWERQYRLTHPLIFRRGKERRRVAGKASMLAQIISAVPNLKCAICGKRMPFKDRTVDHVIPLSKGGTGDVWNLQIVHMRCNQKKGAVMPDELNFNPSKP